MGMELGTTGFGVVEVAPGDNVDPAKTGTIGYLGKCKTPEWAQAGIIEHRRWWLQPGDVVERGVLGG